VVGGGVLVFGGKGTGEIEGASGVGNEEFGEIE